MRAEAKKLESEQSEQRATLVDNCKKKKRVSERQYGLDVNRALHVKSKKSNICLVKTNVCIE